ncbi:MAG: hypothetical protein ACYC56_13145, partial [Candidatus Aquicultor sp.]
MNHRVARSFVAVVLLVLLSLILYGCKSKIPKQAKQPKGVVISPVVFKSNGHDVLSLNPIPRERPELALLKVREESLDTVTILKMFGFNPKEIERHDAPQLGGSQFILRGQGNGQKYTESITIRPHNDILYQRDGKFYDGDPGLTEDEARQMAQKFIQSHGGMPADAVLDSITPSFYGFIKNPESGKKVVHQYQLVYVSGKNKDGYYVDGANRITIVIDSKDVIRYERFWRHPMELTGKPQRVMAAQDALSSAIDAILNNHVTALYLPPKSFVTPAASPAISAFFGSGGLSEAEGYADGLPAGEINLYKMELVYFSPTPRVSTDTLHPVWKVNQATTNSVAFIDAYTGKFINVGTEKREYLDEARKNAVRQAAKLSWVKAAVLRANQTIEESLVRIPYPLQNIADYTLAGEKVWPSFPRSLPVYIRDNSKKS